MKSSRENRHTPATPFLVVREAAAPSSTFRQLLSATLSLTNASFDRHVLADHLIRGVRTTKTATSRSIIESQTAPYGLSPSASTVPGDGKFP